MFDPIRDALDHQPGQILKQWAFEDVPDLQLFQLKICPRYVELKKQALKEAELEIEQWAHGRSYDSFAQAFRLVQGYLISQRGEINIVTPAHDQPIPPQTRVGIHPRDDPNAVQSIEWQQKSYIFKPDECITVLDGEIDLVYTRVYFTGSEASQETEPAAKLAAPEAAAEADLPTIAPTDAAKTVAAATSLENSSIVTPSRRMSP